jgi:hypothetical protein
MLQSTAAGLQGKSKLLYLHPSSIELSDPHTKDLKEIFIMLLNWF